jgi:DNA-binding response OmpR family regulator
MLRSRRIDLALVDWNLSGITGGGMTGGDVVRRMRKENAALPILMVTGETGHATVLAARDAGADGYLVKPVSKAELAARVKFVLGKRAEAAGPSVKTAAQRAGR